MICGYTKKSDTLLTLTVHSYYESSSLLKQDRESVEPITCLGFFLYCSTLNPVLERLVPRYLSAHVLNMHLRRLSISYIIFYS